MKTLIFTLLFLVLGVSFAFASPEAVVEVTTSRGRGNGVFILINGQVRVLTNAHVIGENSQVSVITSQGEVFGQVETLLGEDDLAVLKIQGGFDSPFRKIARKNLEICTQGSMGLCEETPGAPLIYSGDDEILTRVNGQIETVIPQANINGSSLVDDLYISGNYKKVWHLQVLTRDGVSGGAFYKRKVFMGLVTKVSRGMQNYAIAIPREEITRVLKFNIGKRNSLKLAEGGDPGNGGGPLEKSSLAQATHWTLLQSGCSSVNCEGKTQIINPFSNALNAQALDIRGQQVAMLYRENGSESLFQTATMPLYRWLEKENINYKSLSMNSSELSQLLESREEKTLRLYWLRAWQKLSPGILRNIDPVANNLVNTALHVFNIAKVAGPDLLAFRSGSIRPIDVGADGNTSLRIRIQGQNQEISVKKDLSEIWIGPVSNTRSEVLVAQPMMNPMKRLYLSSSGDSKAVLVYSDRDLSILESLIIETNKMVYEFTLNNPNFGVLK